MVFSPYHDALEQLLSSLEFEETLLIALSTPDVVWSSPYKCVVNLISFLMLCVKLNISRREIFVYTIGSPRVGNVLCADVHRIPVYVCRTNREVVPIH